MLLGRFITAPLPALLLLAVTTGCALVPGETRVPVERQAASPHHYYHVPRHPGGAERPVQGLAKLDPRWWVKNSDDPLPWWWKPEAPLEVRRRTWFLRNPFHNFTHYVIGITDRHHHRYGIDADSLWNENGRLNLAVSRAGPFIYLPMVSYRGAWLEWYLGWRRKGSFGGALRRAQHDSDGTGPRGNSPKSRAREWLAQQQAEDTSAESSARPEVVRLPRVAAQ